MKPRKTGSIALGIVFLTVFLDLVGFGIVLPLLPFYATELGASPFEVGLIIASYSAMQFLFAPIWGALSDHFGRRPLLLVGLFGSAVSYVVFGLASTLEVLLLSRVIAGIMGANIPVAQAYIADSTSSAVACVAIISTWIAFQLSMIREAFALAGRDVNPYAEFLASLPYNFHCWFTLVLLFVAVRRPFHIGPMRGVVHRARRRTAG